MHQRGNILFLILLAVVLLAALTFAVNGSFRVTQDQNIPKEKANSIAAEMMQKTLLIEQTVTRLKVTGGCKDTELQFTGGGMTYDTVSPADKHCYVFDPAGGGANVPTFSSDYYDPALSGAARWGGFVVVANMAPNIGTDCANPYLECADLVLMVPYVKKDICTAINKANGVTGIPQVGSSIQLNRFNDYQNTNGTPNTGKFLISGYADLCTEGKDQVYGSSGITNPYTGAALNAANGGGGTYYYYHVVLAR